MILLRLSWKNVASALFLGLALRLFFTFHFPFYAGDTKFYEELARNWLYHGVYGLFIQGQLVPVDQRMPGYPAFLAAIYAIWGRSRIVVRILQAIIDLGTCALIAEIAARLSPATQRRRIATAALWLAVLCPFTANYTAAVLTETLATFFTAAAALALVNALVEICTASASNRSGPSLQEESSRKKLLAQTRRWMLCGFIVGLGTLVRPETPLLLAAAGLVLAFYWWRPASWSNLALAGSWMLVGLLIPLTPWAARNARTLGRIEFLSPFYAESRGDFIPRGFISWTRTWMIHFHDAYEINWKFGKQPIDMQAFPASAFDSAEERAYVANLLAHYDADINARPILDQDFAALAHERTERHPLRVFVYIPMARAWNIWFTPRIELLPYSGALRPPVEKWHANPWDFGITLGFGFLDFFYAGLALVGLIRFWKEPLLKSEPNRGPTLAIAFLVLFVLIRTVLLTQIPTVEPRYVIPCFPVVLAIGAQVWSSKSRRTA